jgi:Ni/Fe-hydrogenase subunit HybB-like protein
MIQYNSEDLFKVFKPQLEKTSRAWYSWFVFFLICFAFGVTGFIHQLRGGHIVTGMRDNVVWGVYIVNFIFFMGLSYAGALISGSLHLFRTHWRRPIMRMVELLTVVSLMIGPVFILFCVGRFEKIPYLFIYPRIQSPIMWDVIAILTDLFGCIIFIYLSYIEDLAFLRDHSKDLKVANWQKKFYEVVSLGYTGTPTQAKRIRFSRNVMAAIIIAIAIIVYSVLAWIFGVTLQPGWHSTIFGPYFVIAAVYSGTGVLIILMWIFRKMYKLENYIKKQHFVNIGVLLFIIGAFYGYFTFADYLTKWYGSVKMDKELIDKLFKEFYWQFIVANYVGVLVPMIIIAFPKFRTINNITIGAVITVFALWMNRYLIVIPTLETPYLPIQDTRPDWISYHATWVEWSLTLAGIAVYGMLFMIASKLVPIISISEMSHIDAVRESEEIEQIL